MPLLESLLLPYAVTLTVFALLWPLSIYTRDASIVDYWWAPGFLVQVGISAMIAEQVGWRGGLLLALMALWSARLSWVLIARRLREGHEDPRYTSLRAAWGEGFWWKSLFVVFVLQATIQWVIAIGPMTGVLAQDSPLQVTAYLGVFLALLGFALEAKADAELDAFKRHSEPNALCQSGLRAYVRHPNYVGEILFWIGIGLIVSEVSIWAGLLSPVVIGMFLIGVSGAPMLDERLAESRPDYAAYKARVPAFLPRLSGNARQADRQI